MKLMTAHDLLPEVFPSVEEFAEAKQTFFGHPVEICQQLSHIFRKEVWPRYEPGGSGPARAEIRTLAREWAKAAWMYANTAFAFWCFYIGVVGAVFLASLLVSHWIGWM